MSVWSLPAAAAREFSILPWTQVDPGAGANAWGGWLEAVASLPRTTTEVTVSTSHAATSVGAFCMQVGIGPAGSEVPVIPFIPATNPQRNTQELYANFTVPMVLPGGVRVAVRANKDSTGSIGHRLRVEGHAGQPVAHAQIAQAGVEYGCGQNALDRGLDLMGVSVNHSAGFVEITPATARDHSIWSLTLVRKDTNSGSRLNRIDVATGPAGSEQVQKTLWLGKTDSSYPNPHPMAQVFHAPIPSGSRIAVRIVEENYLNLTHYTGLVGY